MIIRTILQYELLEEPGESYLHHRLSETARVRVEGRVSSRRNGMRS